MGLGLLASKAMRPPSRFLLGSQNPNNFHLRTIVSKPELRNPEASTAQLQQLPPPPDLPPWSPLTRARVHFSNPEDAIEVFVEGYAGIDIPRFCYHTDSLSPKTIACLVEVEKSSKPVASCAMPALPYKRWRQWRCRRC